MISCNIIACYNTIMLFGTIQSHANLLSVHACMQAE